MKFLLTGILAIILMHAVPIFAQDAGKPAAPLMLIKNPIRMNYGSFPQLAVTFNHSTHKDIKCSFCHHKAESRKTRYAECTTAGCHDVKGARQRGKNSVFMAYHDPKSDRSCFGCHKREASRYPQFTGCRPCHTSPLSKETAAAK